jgi:hypothetical protein
MLWHEPLISHAVTCCRRALRSRWYELADAAETAAEEAARQAEVHAWKSQGAAVKVRACETQLAGTFTQVCHLWCL